MLESNPLLLKERMLMLRR